ncbi:MAG: presqualene diphosphate synthase HpnD [Rhodospirillaceae bacterium]|nr:presqualene diphosphate synthase HpnD [Rhodospirillaceae bacterium]MBT4463628.1 presqualene diphosphate synthase HpnD [Rhodospirillaceae bacterium]MBT5013859.1 presqualene diphosphate synthase HpnD [Rhodospirillaceae bacterium]MBT5308074.1 presqualene diphosphate synthase HpnD [Rhodospirillaceae bacterium]MBT6406121.1 presqualene diphosphate synthase HpnD [Rhodospirillaceae bacterium]
MVSGVAAAAHAEAMVRTAGTSFYWAMRLLPIHKRRAMFAIYAFCREVDDIADEVGETADKHKRLSDWREEVERLYAGKASTPISVALSGPMLAFGLNKRDLLDVIDGMEMDAGERVRIADSQELDLYCDRVACAVGRLSNRVFGIDEETGDIIANALGQALQLTNILRDVAEDAERDRMYLPRDLLGRHGIDTDDVAEVLAHPNLRDVCLELADICQQRFTEADAALAECNRRQMRPAIIMMEIYRRIFQRLQKQGWRDFKKPVAISKLHKLWVALRYGLMP